MNKPLIVVVDPQHPERDIEHALCGSDYDIEFVPYDLAPGTALPDAVYARADAWLNYRGRHRLSDDILAKMTRCRIIVTSGVGYDHIDIVAAARRGVPVCNVPDYGTTEVADHALALLLSLTRGVASYDATLREAGGWAALGMPTVRRLRGLRFGIVGLGRIGVATARRASGFDMQVRFFDPLLPPGAELAVGYRRHISLHDLMADSDIVSLHTPLTPDTRGMIDADALAALPPGAILINTSRGGVVDLDAIADALRAGRLQAAGLDVLPTEPPDYGHPLLRAWREGEDWIRNRLIITPHSAFYAPESIADKRRLTTSTANDYLRTGALRACLNQHLL